MADSMTRPHSLRRQLRILTTLGLCLLCLTGLWAIWHQKTEFGLLCWVAAFLLIQGSLWSRKARRRKKTAPLTP